MDGRSLLERVDDLEYDNNLLRSNLAEVQTENMRLSMDFEALGKRIDRLCKTVDDFVGRFTKVN